LFLYRYAHFIVFLSSGGFIASVIYSFLSARLAVTFAKSSVELCAPCNIPASQNRASTSSTNMLLHFTSGGTAFPTLLVTVASHSFLSIILLARIPGTFFIAMDNVATFSTASRYRINITAGLDLWQICITFAGCTNKSLILRRRPQGICLSGDAKHT